VNDLLMNYVNGGSRRHPNSDIPPAKTDYQQI